MSLKHDSGKRWRENRVTRSVGTSFCIAYVYVLTYLGINVVRILSRSLYSELPGDTRNRTEETDKDI